MPITIVSGDGDARPPATTAAAASRRSPRRTAPPQIALRSPAKELHRLAELVRQELRAARGRRGTS